MFSIVLYKRLGAYEWGNRYFFSGTPTSDESAKVLALRNAEQPLLHVNVSFARADVLGEQGQKIGEYTFTSASNGAATGEILPINYCALIRLLSDGPERPSVKYLHGITETQIANGEPAGGFLTSVSTYGGALAAAGVTDSEGFVVEAAIWRRFSRRRRMRLLVQ